MFLKLSSGSEKKKVASEEELRGKLDGLLPV